MAVLRKTISQANAQAEDTASSGLATLQGADNFATDPGKLASDVSQANTDLAGEKSRRSNGVDGPGGPPLRQP